MARCGSHSHPWMDTGTEASPREVRMLLLREACRDKGRQKCHKHVTRRFTSLPPAPSDGSPLPPRMTALSVVFSAQGGDIQENGPAV